MKEERKDGRKEGRKEEIKKGRKEERKDGRKERRKERRKEGRKEERKERNSILIKVVIDYYHVAFAHAQKASAHSIAYTGNVENVELQDCYLFPCKIRHKLVELPGAKTNSIEVYCKNCKSTFS